MSAARPIHARMPRRAETMTQTVGRTAETGGVGS